MSRRLRWVFAFVVIALVISTLGSPAHAQMTNPINHIIVVYMENWSFDSLYWTFPGANGLDKAKDAPHQVDKNGKAYDTLPPALNSNQKDANGNSAVDSRFPANLPNAPFEIDKYVATSDLIGDMVHRYYQEQYQIDGGKMDKFVAW